MSTQEIFSGHTHATLERIRAQEIVWLGQDTTFLHDGTPQPKAGMGTVKIKTREEYLLHPTVVFTPERINVGVVGMKVWQRPEQPVVQQRKRKPIEEKESYRWLEGYQCAYKVKQACPATLRSRRTSARARHRSRLASSSSAGTSTGLRSPERLRRASVSAPQRLVLTRSPASLGISEGAPTQQPWPCVVKER
jgi:hypothetical protein